MVRYKRYKKRYKNSTRFVRMKFQSFMDIHTTVDDMQIISISAGGKELLERLPGFFSTFKYYKIGNISVKLVPASTLPVDPTGLSLEVSDPGVDPRDQLTPGMMRITNGEDIFEDLTGLSAADQHNIYNSMMLDPRWFKWMLQSGVKRHAVPKYWQIGQLHQDKWPGAMVNMPLMNADGTVLRGTSDTQWQRWSAADAGTVLSNSTPNQVSVVGASSMYGIFQTGHKGVLGWLPTDGMQMGTPMITSPPEIECFKIILPPAYKTEYHYRAYISQTVLFKEPIVMALSGQYGGFRPLDVFHATRPPVPTKPISADATTLLDYQTGGNYGDD